MFTTRVQTSTIVSLGMGIIFLFVGINNLWPDFIINKGEQIAVVKMVSTLIFIEEIKERFNIRLVRKRGRLKKNQS